MSIDQQRELVDSIGQDLGIHKVSALLVVTINELNSSGKIGTQCP